MRQLRLSVILGVDGCRYIDSGHTGKHGLDLSTENFLRRGEIKIYIKLVAAGGHLAIDFHKVRDRLAGGDAQSLKINVHREYAYAVFLLSLIHIFPMQSNPRVLA